MRPDQKVSRATVLRLLKQKPTLKYSEIAARAGVSRERIRQLADLLLFETGKERLAAVRREKYGSDAPATKTREYNKWYYATMIRPNPERLARFNAQVKASRERRANARKA